MYPSDPTDPEAPKPPRGLLDHDWQKLLIFLLTLLAGVAVMWVIWQIVSPLMHTLVLFILAAVLAFALSSPVNMVAKRVGNRVLAIVVVYVLFGALVIGGIALLAGPFVSQASDLVAALPRYATDLQARAPEVQTVLGQYGIEADINELKAGTASAIQKSGTDVLQNLVGTLAEVGSTVFDIVLALVISVYLIMDGPAMGKRMLAAVPSRHRPNVIFVQENVARVLGGYLRGQFTLGALIGLATGIGMGLLGLPFAIVLGVLAGLFELVPMFGPILSAVPAVFVALFQPFPTVVWVLLFFLVIQQVENNILAPRISGHAVGLHPLGALFALLAGFQLAGVLGGLFAVPVAGVIWVLISAAYRKAVASEPPPRRWGLPRRLRRTPVPAGGERPEAEHEPVLNR